MATATQTNGASTLQNEPATMEAVIVSGELRGKLVNVTKTPDGTFNLSEPELTPEEIEVLEAVVEASKKAEASAIRAGKTAERIIERMQRLKAELNGENP